ncbi:hypothetical protein AgCh_013830 [Apium graveolens]
MAVYKIDYFSEFPSTTMGGSCPYGLRNGSIRNWIIHGLYWGNILCHDYQEIKIQESTQVLDVSAIPRSLPDILKDDLVDIVKVGVTCRRDNSLILLRRV